MIFCFMVLLISCSKNNNTNNRINTSNNDIITEEKKVEQNGNISQQELENNSPEMIDKVTYYHAELAESNDIQSKELNKNWIKVFIFTKENIQQFQKDLLGDDMNVSLTKDLDGDGIVEQVITGTFLDNNNNEGNFIAIISGTQIKEVYILSNQPTLLHFRAFDSVIYFGSGFASEYRKQITWNDNKFSVSDVLPD